MKESKVRKQEDIRKNKPFLFLKLQDALFNRIAHDETGHHNRIHLANSMYTIDSLLLCGRIPPLADDEG